MKVRRKKREKQVAANSGPVTNDGSISEAEDRNGLFAFTYEGAEYMTLLTKKFTSRKPYVPPDPKKIHAFIPGTIVRLSVKEKSKVHKGETLLSLQAMKMNNNILSTLDGTIKKIHVKKGDVVVKNQLLIEFR